MKAQETSYIAPYNLMHHTRLEGQKAKSIMRVWEGGWCVGGVELHV